MQVVCRNSVGFPKFQSTCVACKREI